MPCNQGSVRPDKVFCELSSQDMTSYHKQDCPYCKEDEKALIIDERYYYPKQQRENLVSLPSKYVKKGSNMRPHLDLLGSIEGAFCVHRDDPNDEENPRHHAFYVDVVKLMESDEFIRVFEKKLDQLEAKQGVPNTIVYPPHNAAKSMLKVALEKWKIKHHIASHNLKRLDDKDRSFIKTCEHICILDDVIITGGRIDGYVRSIRESLQLDSNVFRKLSVLVAVQRVESSDYIKRLKDGSLSNQNAWGCSLYYVAKLYLPNWGEKECPWCKEANIWGQVDPPFSEPSYYKSRMAALNSGASSGILYSPIPKFQPDKKMALGSSSPLANTGATEIHVLFVVAVALQMMRYDPDSKIRLVRTFVTNNALDVKNTVLSCGEEKNVFKRYTEPLIQACLLRCAKPAEWSNEMLQSGIPQLISSLNDKGTHVLLLEIMFYLKRCAYKSVLARDLEEYFQQYAEGSEDQDPALSVLSSMCD